MHILDQQITILEIVVFRDKVVLDKEIVFVIEINVKKNMGKQLLNKEIVDRKGVKELVSEQPINMKHRM